MFDPTFSLIFAVYFALCCSYNVVYDTPFYECKELCCTEESCHSFDVVLSSLECYLNEEVNSTADENESIDKNLNGTRMEEKLALRGSCSDWEKNPDGCMISLKFRTIWAQAFGKTAAQQENAVNYVTTTLSQGTKATTNAVKSLLVCPITFSRDRKSATCWKVVSTRITRLKAEQYCARLITGGRLAVLDTSEKYEFVKNLLSTSSHMVCVHVGGKKLNISRFIWLNKVNVGSQGWCPGQPSGHNEKQWLSLWPEMGYCFDDISVNYECDFVCEGHQ